MEVSFEGLSVLDERLTWLRDYLPYDVFLNSPPFQQQIVMRRLPAYAMVATNVPHRIVHHSPNGFDFGYGGAGPADLALNILEGLLLQEGFQGRRVDCRQGNCFEVAFLLHQDFKDCFIAPLPQQVGGVVPYPLAWAWLRPFLPDNFTELSLNCFPDLIGTGAYCQEPPVKTGGL